ncbi:hypothetical protein CCO03_03005 [Comamonas serinivorans]|uniref:DUF1010 domain-containing protein n=1 Tax=Comamonas serinivorans TaxID=1082851 RepID=A0A1Y0EK30_9BURK|nr:DUF1010 domain-containing protein [Comamonas serinivorans]ARU03788.1 hypothetical protein CCO03_03005 [Comamonas serinivorans]
MQARIHSSASPFSQVSSRGFWRCAGLRLRWLDRFQVFLAAGARLSSAACYLSCSAAPLPWPSAFPWAAHVCTSRRSLFAFWPNHSVKPIRLRRPAYFRR